MAVSAPVVRAKESTSLVDLLVWTYQRQRADVMSGKGLHTIEAIATEDDDYHGGWSGDGCAALEQCGALGAIIPGTGHMQYPELHPDAERVHDAVVALSQDNWLGAMLLRRYGRQGGAPQWRVHQEWEPVLVDGKPAVLIAEHVMVGYPHRITRRVAVTYCPIQRYPSDDWVELVRSEFRAWLKALVELKVSLSGRELVRWSIDRIGVGGRA